MTEQKLTEQGMFNKVWEHFVTNRAPLSMNVEEDLCMYRGPKGTRCAVGVCIPDDLYNYGMEGQKIATVMDKFPEIEELFEDIGFVFLTDLQHCHDHSSPLIAGDSARSIPDLLHAFAINYELSCPPEIPQRSILKPEDFA